MTQPPNPTTFDHWVDDRELRAIGTNHGSRPVAFQSWQKFKEAFAPEIVLRAITECRRPVQTVLDPFGGSGTTGLASQFLGVNSVLMEVNPYLADLIEAKLTHYDLTSLQRDAKLLIDSLLEIVGADETLESRAQSFSTLPNTFIEPGVNSRWIFSQKLGGVVAGALDLADNVTINAHRRLFRVAIGGVLVAISNVRVSGKGRRYRAHWRDREMDPSTAAQKIRAAIENTVADIERFQPRQTSEYRLIRGDSRQMLNNVSNIDVAVFSPPYPNSFDYTDVYNVELWMLGYLTNPADNRSLRSSTLASHVQIRRDYRSAPEGSGRLASVLCELESNRADLWDRHLPAMVGAYFAEMVDVLQSIYIAMNPQAEVWMVVGDSRYSGIDVCVADILVELAPSIGFETITQEPFRSMRSSPQQGGALELSETLIVLRKLAIP